MNVEKASRIVKSYEAVIAKGAIGETVLRKGSWLPYSSATIKYAFYVLLEDMVKRGVLDEAAKRPLVEAYSTLSSFIGDDLADKYSRNYETWQVKKSDPLRTKRDESLIKQYVAYASILRQRSEELRGEIEGLVGELGGRTD